jgi:hypothetical protein
MNSEGLCQIRELILLQEKCEHCNQQTEEETKLNALRDIQHLDGKQRLSSCHTKATVMNMKLCFIRVLEVWPLTTLLWRIVSDQAKLLRQELGFTRMTFRNGGHQGVIFFSEVCCP